MWYELKGREVVALSNDILETDPYKVERLLADIDNRKVNHTEFSGCNVSSVFLVLDAGMHFYEDSVPILFETMLFGGILDHHQQRHVTYDQAEHWHYEICAHYLLEIPTAAKIVNEVWPWLAHKIYALDTWFWSKVTGKHIPYYGYFYGAWYGGTDY